MMKYSEGQHTCQAMHDQAIWALLMKTDVAADILDTMLFTVQFHHHALDADLQHPAC